MINDFYYDLLSLNDNFLPMINEFEIFKHINQAHFIFLSMDKSRIIYQYDFNSKNMFYEAIFKKIHEESIPFFENKFINYRIWDNILLENTELDNKSGVWVAASIYQCLAENINDYCCVILFYAKNLDTALNIRTHLNENYLIQTSLHVNMVIKNYEKLSYNIDSFVEMISKKDVYMPYHMTNVANLCMNVASKLDLDKRQTNILYIAALIHDIGKLHIPDKIINKPGPLDENEFNRIKTHSAKGEEIAKSAFWGMDLLKEIPQIIRSHHENYDGSGYPDSLIGNDINLLSRIIRVADSVDSMLSRFPYKEPLERPNVIDILFKNSGTHFDPVIVNLMIEVLNENNALDAHMIVKKPQFLPKTVLSFFYKDSAELVSILGNLVIDSNGTRFILHQENNYNLNFNHNYIYKATFSFFNQRILYEYSADIINVSEDYLTLKNIVYIPSDKYFSLSWDSDIYIKKSQDNFLKANIINLGVETIIIKTFQDSTEFLIENFANIIRCLLIEVVDDINLDMLVDLNIIKYYIGDSDTIFVCKYENLTALQKDQILKLLFRKQVLLRKSKPNIKIR